ncbi:ABC transporter ATP-binding protein [Burkholderia sp. Bp8986]|uniref:ABC transporter ATP-binding protein n=1 Tax=Burkholderia sp. Bp8986 TaxID=2184550 RepID=UPI000F5ADCFA|nr:polyamine ABC transporter ATP-binding protein [Burkholderia sp. Bp8986]RQS52748.1 polyamine ABC transporter ATP-binding protein [Burkholderia sp. Bp8986]
MNLTDAAPLFQRPANLSDPAHSDAGFVRIEKLVKKFGDAVAVQEVDLCVGKGELFALLGSSGCGKSTLLRMLAGFEAPTSGRILVDGTDITECPPYRRPVNMMFQSYALFPHLSVAQNVAFGLKWEKMTRHARRERVMQMLELVQMASFANRRPDQLSGGQQQRVALARSLAKQPKLLLLDEPMSALDRQIRQQTQLELVKIIEKVGVTCIMVTHDQEEAMAMADRLAIMSAGNIVQTGTPRDVYEYPNCRFTASFIGTTNILEGTIHESSPDHTVIRCGQLESEIYVGHGITGSPGMAVAVSVRPTRVRVSRRRIADERNCAVGTVVDTVYMGDYSSFHVALASGRTLLSHVPVAGGTVDRLPAAGEEVTLCWDADDVMVLTA